MRQLLSNKENKMTDRRRFVKTLFSGGAGALLTTRSLVGQAPLREFNLINAALSFDQKADDPWSQVPKILARIKPPVFPKRDFQVTDFGAVGDGAKDCTDAFQKAIAACNRAAGGRVVVPAGTFLTGAIHLQSNVNLHISEGATVKFATDPKKYLPVVFTRFEGIECLNFSPLIYAFEQDNIAITGTGVLDGSASKENWWAWARRGADDTDSPARRDIRRLLDFGERGVPVEQRIFGP